MMTENKVSPAMLESVSALVDGEATDLELRRVLRDADAHPVLRQHWARYQLIGAAIRRDITYSAGVDLSAGIGAVIAEDDTFSHSDISPRQTPKIAAESRSSTGWWASLTKVAVAASVAGVVVVSAQLWQGGASGAGSAPGVAVDTPAVNQPAFANLPAGFAGNTLSARTVSTHPKMDSVTESRALPQLMVPSQFTPVQQKPSPELQGYLQRVMEMHAANVANESAQGLLPYARVPATAE